MNLVNIPSVLKKALVFPLYLLSRASKYYVGLLEFLRPGVTFSFRDQQLQEQLTTVRRIALKIRGVDAELKVYAPNALTVYRVETFFSKEPETLDWIDEFGGDGPLYDVGANIGLYSLYYATVKRGKVYAFEPSVLNTKLLSMNASLNNLAQKIRVVPNPLSESNGFGYFKLSSLVEGGAMSTFGVDYGHDGTPIDVLWSYQTLGLSLDYLLTQKLLDSPPQLLKIDVDGIEHMILEGASETLKSEGLRSILLEINDNFEIQADRCKALLEKSGFRLMKKARSVTHGKGAYESTFNQIWNKI